jgi:hypothetical protein
MLWVLPAVALMAAICVDYLVRKACHQRREHRRLLELVWGAGRSRSASAGEPSPSDACRGCFSILYFGSASEGDGLPVLLRAFEALYAVGVVAELTIVGPSRAAVDLYPFDLQGVRIVEEPTQVDVARLLRESDVLCLPSLSDRIGVTVLAEALAAGTPVVCSDIDQFREVVRDQIDGLLLPPGDPAGLGEALHYLATNPALRERMASAALAGAGRFPLHGRQPPRNLALGGLSFYAREGEIASGGTTLALASLLLRPGDREERLAEWRDHLGAAAAADADLLPVKLSILLRGAIPLAWLTRRPRWPR